MWHDFHMNKGDVVPDRISFRFFCLTKRKTFHFEKLLSFQIINFFIRWQCNQSIWIICWFVFFSSLPDAHYLIFFYCRLLRQYFVVAIDVLVENTVGFVGVRGVCNVQIVLYGLCVTCMIVGINFLIDLPSHLETCHQKYAQKKLDFAKI